MDLRPIFDHGRHFEFECREDGMVTFEIQAAGIDPLLAEFPSTFAGYPYAFYSAIGAVVGQWGSLENTHLSLLDLMIRSNAGPELSSRIGFGQRNKRLQMEAQALFGGTTTLMPIIDRLIARLGELFVARNYLAHGRLSCRFQRIDGDGLSAEDYSIQIHAEAYIRGKPESRSFSMKDLESIFYAMSGCSGVISAMIDQPDWVPGLSLQDKLALRAFQEKGRRHQPI